MDSLKLQKWQVQQMHDRLAPTLGYLSRMCQRMDRTHFPPDDELRRITMEAQETMQCLVMHLHYLSCGMIGLHPFGQWAAEERRKLDAAIAKAQTRNHTGESGS